MTCRICNHPARQTNDHLVLSLWNDGGYKIGPSMGAYDAYTYNIRIRQMMGFGAPYPCGLCVPGACAAPASSRPNQHKENDKLKRLPRQYEQDGADALLFKGLSKAIGPATKTMAGDVAFSLSQQSKLQAACFREGMTAIKRCTTDISAADIAKATGLALTATALKGNPISLRVASVDAGVAAAVETSRHPACDSAIGAMIQDDCIKRNMPKGYIHISSELKKKK